jgi:hypothetical protein
MLDQGGAMVASTDGRDCAWPEGSHHRAPGGGQGGQQAEKFARGDLRTALAGGERVNESPLLHDQSAVAAGDALPEFARRRPGYAARSPTVVSVRPPDPMTLKTSGP